MCSNIEGVNGDKSVIYEALFELSRSISGHNDLDSLCRALAKSLKKVVAFDYLALLLYDASGNMLRMPSLATEEIIHTEALPASFPLEGNPAGWVWKQQQPLFISRIECETRWADFLAPMRERGLSSLILVPLTTGDHRLGVLSFAFKEVSLAGEEERAFLHRVASEFAVTIESYLTKQKYLHERDRLQLLFDVTNALVSKLSPEELFRALSEQLNRVVSSDVAALLLLDNKTGELFLSGIHIAGPVRLDLAMTRTRPDGLPFAEVFSTGKPLLINHPDFERFPSPIFRRLWQDSGIRSACIIPLKTPNAIIGTLDLARLDERPFTGDEVELLVQVANQIAIALENSLSYRELTEIKDRLAIEKRYLEDDIRIDKNFGEMLGESPAFESVLKNIQIVAPTEATVLILGETGTGKELVARKIHELSGRSGNSFVKVNCAAIPSSLLESELFGHEKGAFTGALSQRIGRFELANRGTLFLDEIGEIPLDLQSKLLRAIQEQEFERLGGNRTIRVSVRLVAASNRDLKAMVREGLFRSDLYYRLHVFPIELPPLRDRTEDIPLLARYFTQKYAQRMRRKIDAIPSTAMDALLRYDWPGNIRELQNVIERSVILTRGRSLDLAMPESRAAETAEKPSRYANDSGERSRILRALQESGGVIAGPTGAAARLGLKRTTLQARMKRLNIRRGYE
ncbi:MAG: sigma 54-interacting transcriptional regulator [Acidobacteriota bacterium]|nr:sigma 54-interacting transcriptional regulator [Acidobacteriota bacterium]